MPICITGMHRSGTSMVTRLLHDCGLYLGSSDDLLPASRNNREGFWENRRFLEINDGILNELGSGWDCPPPQPIDWAAERFAPFRREAQPLLAEFANREPWGWKDPRNCLTLPFWQQCVDGLRVVMVVRNPVEVALSLGARNEFSPALGLTLWQISYQRLLDATTPHSRIITHYDAFFHAPEAEMRRLLSVLHMPILENLGERCRSAGRDDLRHHRLPDLDPREAGVSAEVSELYALLCEEAGEHMHADQTRPPNAIGDRMRDGSGAVSIEQRHGAGSSHPASGHPLVATEAASLEAGVGRLSRSVVEAEVLRREANANRLLLTERERRIEDLEKGLRKAVAEREELESGADLLIRARKATEEELAVVQRELAERIERERSLRELTHEKDELQRGITELRLQRLAEEHADLERRLLAASAARGAAEHRAAQIQAELEERLAAAHIHMEADAQRAAQAQVELEQRLATMLAEKEAADQRAIEEEKEIERRLMAAVSAREAADQQAAEDDDELKQWLIEALSSKGKDKQGKRRTGPKKGEAGSARAGKGAVKRQMAVAPAAPISDTPESEGTPAEVRSGIGPRGYPGTDHLRFAVDFPQTLPLRPPTTQLNPGRLDLHWLMSDFGRGMGGPMTIFRTIKLLEEFGHKSTIWTVSSSDPKDARRIQKMIREHFLPLEAEVRNLPGHIEDVCGDAVIATHCWTAYPARAITNVRERFYFVQDFEPYFYPMGSRYLLAEDTYRFGFNCIAASPWLRDLLTSRYGAQAEDFALAYDPSIYFPDARTKRKENHLAFYARIGTERRVVELGLLALDRVAQHHPDLVVHFFGDWLQEFNPPYAYKNHGVLAEHELADLYRRMGVGVVFSSSNYSLIPNEMMACGLPVVELASPCTTAVFPDGVVALAQPNPPTIAETIGTLLADDDLRKCQRARGLEHVAGLTWEKSARRVEAALLSGILAQSPGTQATLPADAAPKRPKLRPRHQSADHRELSFKRPIVFAGQPEYFRQTYFDETSAGTSFEFPFTSADPSALKALPRFVKERGAKTCIIFRPEWLAWHRDVFDELKANGVALIGYSTEPVPHGWANPHLDQVKRLESLKGALKVDYDLIVHFDQSSLRLLKEVGFKRIIAHPLPVSEKLFFPEDRPREFDVCFLGRSTPHREEFLVPLKARYNTLHVAHGLTDDDARILMNRSKMVVNIHTHDYPSFETRNVIALRCQRPLLSESLSGDYLVAGRDYTLVKTPNDLREKVEQILTGPIVPPATADLSLFSIESLLKTLGID